jgi:CRP-like cAMP-binding protein
MNDNALKFSVDAERLSKLGTYFLQSKEGQDAIASGSLKGPDRLFIALASSTLLNTTVVLPGKKIIESGEQFDDAYLILSGEIQIAQKEKSYKLGAGSVIGLSEGMVGLASKFTATALTSVKVKIIPFHRVDAIIKVLPPEVRAILITIIKRNLAP